MAMLKPFALVGAVMLCVSASANEIISNTSFVFVNPETSSFWNTAAGNTVTVQLDYPAGATSASLQVRGFGYSRDYNDITKTTDDGERTEYTFTVPEADSPEAENVYDLTLVFNDAAATVRTAKIGVVESFACGGEAGTRCVVPENSYAWRRLKGHAVMPIPYGTTSFTLNGVETDTGLGGAQGWYAIGGLASGETLELGFTAQDCEGEASLKGALDGARIHVR